MINRKPEKELEENICTEKFYACSLGSNQNNVNQNKME